MEKYYLSIDLGASSGRHILGSLNKDGNIDTKEVYRFKNGVMEKDGHLIWDTDALLKNVINGIKEAFKVCPQIESLSIDSWGVDYALIKGDEVCMPIFAYRDGRTQKPIELVHQIISKEELFERSGIIFQPFNTIYQLYDDKLCGRLDGVTDFLMIPEFLNYKLTGVKMKEYTNASTTGLVNATTKEFDKQVIDKLGLPKTLFPDLKEGGEIVGELLPEIQQIVSGNTKVKLCLSHDTASAFYIAGELGGENSVYISSGTWSLLGTKETTLHNGELAYKHGFTNEGGVNRTYRFLKNIMGMWVINNVCAETGVNPAELARLASLSDYDYTVDVNHADFFAPKSMVDTIKKHLQLNGAPMINDIRHLARSVIASLAKSYAQSVAFLETIVDRKFDNIVIVGGGAKNKLLNDLTQKYSGKKVLAYPIEATAIGNLKIQIASN